MKLQWEDTALSDLDRLFNFLAEKAPAPAARVVQSLIEAASRLTEHPGMGERIPKFAPRELRKLVVGIYELHYEVGLDIVTILRAWSAREER